MFYSVFDVLFRAGVPVHIQTISHTTNALTTHSNWRIFTQVLTMLAKAAVIPGAVFNVLFGADVPVHTVRVAALACINPKHI